VTNKSHPGDSTIEAPGPGWVGSAGIGNQLPLRLVGSRGAVAAMFSVGLAAVSALGTAGDRPRPGAGLGGVAFAVQLHHHHHPRAQGRVVLGPADPLGQLPPDRARTGSSPWLSATYTGSRLGVAGRPLRWRVASMAR
jgi:hypothetical protein